MMQDPRPSKKRQLRCGFTTGTAAAAAAKAALLTILDGRPPLQVTVQLLTGDSITIPVHHCRQINPHSAKCAVIKDAGDDPDVTHGAEIGAKVNLLPSSSDDDGDNRVLISGGIGVGQVTKPGLEVLPGNAAINPGPQRMISQSIQTVLQARRMTFCVDVEVFVPHGIELARKTLNARLGIIGGISILGTTGVVKPMSHEAYIATIKSALSVAEATGQKQIVMSTGRRSERYAQQLPNRLPDEAYIQIGDRFQVALQMTAGHTFEAVTLAVFFGKALKMALGIGNTHANRASMSLSQLSHWTHRLTGDVGLAERIRNVNTARQAFYLIFPDHRQVLQHVVERIITNAQRFAGPGVAIQATLFDYTGDPAIASTAKP